MGCVVVCFDSIWKKNFRILVFLFFFSNLFCFVTILQVVRWDKLFSSGVQESKYYLLSFLDNEADFCELNGQETLLVESLVQKINFLFVKKGYKTTIFIAIAMKCFEFFSVLCLWLADLCCSVEKHGFSETKVTD